MGAHLEIEKVRRGPKWGRIRSTVDRAESERASLRAGEGEK